MRSVTLVVRRPLVRPRSLCGASLTHRPVWPPSSNSNSNLSTMAMTMPITMTMMEHNTRRYTIKSGTTTLVSSSSRIITRPPWSPLRQHQSQRLQSSSSSPGSHSAQHTLFIHNPKHKGVYKGKSQLYLHPDHGWWMSARMRRFWACLGSVAGVAIALYVITNIEEVPITGRKRFVPLSHYWERRIGELVYKEELRANAAHVLPLDHEAVQYVRKIGMRIAKVSGLPDTTEWTFNVVDLPLINAVCFPGGHVIVFGGLLAKVAESATPEDDLAVILGHEIAHAVARHSTEKIAYLVPLLTVAALAESSPLISWAYNFFFQLPYARAQETEADHIGLMLMSRACFRPEVASTFWQNMQSTNSDLHYFSTHPSDDRRARRCIEWLPAAQAERTTKGCPLPHDASSKPGESASIFSRWFGTGRAQSPPPLPPSVQPGNKHDDDNDDNNDDNDDNDDNTDIRYR